MSEIHIDTDLGGDIDDLCALAMVLAWPGASICGITTVAEHGGKRAGYVRRALSLASRGDVVVRAGAEDSLGNLRPLPPEERYWPDRVAPAKSKPDDSLDLLQRNIERGATIVAIGPYTNLALLERRNPGILEHAILFLMGGYAFGPPQGFPQRGFESDYNVQADSESAYLVFQRSSPTMIPLAVTVQTALRRSDLPRLRSAGPLAQLIAHQAEAYASDERYEERYGRKFAAIPQDIINFHHDPLACAVALGWNDGIDIEELRIVSTLDGGLVRQRVAGEGRPTKIVTRIDGNRFGDLWIDLVTMK